MISQLNGQDGARYFSFSNVYLSEGTVKPQTYFAFSEIDKSSVELLIILVPYMDCTRWNMMLNDET